MMTPARSTPDVVIVGGGPAGLATALALRQRGAAVTVIDGMRPPIDKACGEGLMPDSLRELAELGVSLDAEDGGLFQGIRFVHHPCQRAGRLPGTPASVATAHFPFGIGLGLARQSLHRKLVAAAETAGVRLRWATMAQLEAGGRLLAGGEAMGYGWLVGADGQGSRVRRWAGLDAGRILSRRFGFRQHFAVAPWSEFVEVHWCASGQAYVTPVNANEVCVATLARDPQHRVETMLSEMPWLAEKLRGANANATPRDAKRGAVTTTRRLRSVARGRVALVGDASGSADAITGEGMAMGFRQALLLAACLEAGDLARYNTLHPRILRLPQTMARVMLAMDHSTAFRTRALHMLAREPKLFARMLGVHVGLEPLAKFVAARGWQMAWRLAMPPGATEASLAESA